jgi:hypothetical protein
MSVLPEPISRVCHSQFPAYHHEGERRQASIRYIVLHSTEGGTAESVARYFMQPESGGSANLVVDDYSCFRCLGDNVAPWGAPPLNTFGFHIEQCGYAAWSRKRWLLHRLTIRRAAYKAALRMKWYGIPARVLDVEELVKDFFLPADLDSHRNPGPMQGGIVTHATVSAAYHQSSHTDPGSNYPMDVFLSYVEKFLPNL